MAISLPIRLLGLPRVGITVRAGVGLDTVLAGGLFGLALAVRWPNLLLLPPFPAAGAPILQALDVAAGRALPLADQAPYLGPIFVYLLAAVFKLFGPSVEVTLLLPWALGSLSVVPVYLIGRELGGRSAGVVAAALLATSGAHVVVSSHVPWVNSLTPLFATTTLWLLARAVVWADGRSLALAGLGAGLSLQTHPTVAPLLLGAAGAVLLRRPGWLRSRWPYLAVGLLVLGYSNLLAYHLQTRFAVVGDVQSKQERYLDADVDPRDDPDQGAYVNNLHQLGLSLTRLISGAIDEQDTEAEYWLDPRVLAYPVVGLAGLALAARRGHWLLPLGLAAGVFLPPLLNGKYKPILDGRYLMPLVPVAFVAIGLALAALGARVGPPRPRLLRSSLAVVLGGLLVLSPLRVLAEFYEDGREDGLDNLLYLRTLDQIEAARTGDETVLLDARLKDVKTVGGGKASSTFPWLLAVSGAPSDLWDGDPGSLVGHLAILERETADRLDEQVNLLTPDGRRQNGRYRQNYGAYRVAAP